MTRQRLNQINEELGKLNAAHGSFYPVIEVAQVLRKFGLDESQLPDPAKAENCQLNLDLGNGIFMYLEIIQLASGDFYEVTTYVSPDYVPPEVSNDWDTKKRKQMKRVLSGVLQELPNYYDTFGQGVGTLIEKLEVLEYPTEPVYEATGTARVGDGGNLNIELLPGTFLHIHWYQFETTGRFEFTSYVS